MALNIISIDSTDMTDRNVAWCGGDLAYMTDNGCVVVIRRGDEFIVTRLGNIFSNSFYSEEDAERIRTKIDSLFERERTNTGVSFDQMMVKYQMLSNKKFEDVTQQLLDAKTKSD